jgi:methionine synthase II (cobalamin-independent)
MMLTSTDHILTTHAGSLPRPAGLAPDAPDAPDADVARAVSELVKHQLAVGLDVISDGEAGKPSYATYVLERLSGFGSEADTPFLGRGRADLADFPDYLDRLSKGRSAAIGVTPVWIIRYAEVAGRERVMAGTDCGFATFAETDVVDPGIAWAKLAALSEGARLASDRLWPQATRH